MVKSHNPRLLSLPDEQLVALGNTLGRQCPESMQAALAAYLDWATHEAKDVQTTQSLSQGLWQLDLASRLTSDPALLLSALLAPAVMHQIISTEKLENLMGEHGASVAKLMHGFERMSLLDAGAFSGDHGASHAQKMRKMLLAMVDDVRVVTLKLIERLRVMTYLREYPESEHLPTAEAVMWFYAPLANRLGLWSFKNLLMTTS